MSWRVGGGFEATPAGHLASSDPNVRGFRTVPALRNAPALGNRPPDPPARSRSFCSLSLVLFALAHARSVRSRSRWFCWLCPLLPSAGTGDTPLHKAALTGRVQVVEVLLQQPEIDLSCENADAQTALALARNRDVVALLRCTSPGLPYVPALAATQLMLGSHSACGHPSAAVATYVQQTSKALMAAARTGDTASVLRLLAKPNAKLLDLNLHDEANGNTLLHYRASSLSPAFLLTTDSMGRREGGAAGQWPRLGARSSSCTASSTAWIRPSLTALTRRRRTSRPMISCAAISPTVRGDERTNRIVPPS